VAFSHQFLMYWSHQDTEKTRSWKAGIRISCPRTITT